MSNSKKKGNLLEDVVHFLHKTGDYKIKKRIKIPDLSGKRKREIDVLITSNVAGYEIKIAFECKNEKKKIGTGKIESFISKLSDIGVPVCQGIMVSRCGYTEDAILRGKKDRLNMYTVEGLSSDGLKAIAHQAFSGTVFYLCKLKEMIIVPIDDVELKNPFGTLYNSQNQYVGMAYDFLWKAWDSGIWDISSGEKDFEWEINGDAYLKDENGNKPLQFIHFVVDIIPLLVEFESYATMFKYKNMLNEKIEKIGTNFFTKNSTGVFPLKRFANEEELNKYFKSKNGPRIINSVKLGKIDVGPCYWPPSKDAINKITEKLLPYFKGEVTEKPEILKKDIEGDSISAMDNPIDPGWQKFYNQALSKFKFNIKE